MMNNTLYEALPYAYLGAGALNAILLDSPLRYLPSILLFGAGLLVLSWRRSARTQKPKTGDGARHTPRGLAGRHS